MTINTRTWIRATASLFLTVFVVYYAIISAYAHVHVVNGVMVVHSHPFSDQHTHTAGQTLVLHYLTDFHSLEASGSQLVCSPFQPVFFIDYTEHVPYMSVAGVRVRHRSSCPSLFFISFSLIRHQ